MATRSENSDRFIGRFSLIISWLTISTISTHLYGVVHPTSLYLSIEDISNHSIKVNEEKQQGRVSFLLHLLLPTSAKLTWRSRMEAINVFFFSGKDVCSNCFSSLATNHEFSRRQFLSKETHTGVKMDVSPEKPGTKCS